MAKCTDNERKLIDSYLKHDVSSELIESVLNEKITKELRNRYKDAYKKHLVAMKELSDVTTDLYDICSDKHMISIIRDIESEVDDTK